MKIFTLLGDNVKVLKEFPDNSVDAVVTDPPYGLSFMGKKWDYNVPSVELWCEVLRVMKPGAHLLSFGGTRTYHRMVVAIEDAGFEIRDQVMWIYGSGFPKSLNVTKQFESKYECQFLKSANLAANKLKLIPVVSLAERIGFVAINVQTLLAEGLAKITVIGAVEDSNDPMGILPFESTELIDSNTILSLSEKLAAASRNTNSAITLTELKTIIDLKIWNVFQFRNTLKSIVAHNHTALKPANEPIVLARKPLEKGLTVAQNVEKWGVGALNIDGCRIGFSENESDSRVGTDAKWNGKREASKHTVSMPATDNMLMYKSNGRWPANVLLDEVAAEMLDEQTIELKGNTSRFFYVAKASKRERGKDNGHPTVKPIRLMEYLCKLITPPGGTILDPFMGSGSTGVAAKNLDFSFIGIELEPEYAEIAKKRLMVKNEKK